MSLNTADFQYIVGSSFANSLNQISSSLKQIAPQFIAITADESNGDKKAFLRRITNLDIGDIDAYGIERIEGNVLPVDYKKGNEISTLFKESYKYHDLPYILNTESILHNFAASIGVEFVKENPNPVILEKRTKILGYFKSICNTTFSVMTGKVCKMDSEYDKIKMRHQHLFGKYLLPFNKLGVGYQSLLTWIMDFSYRMFNRYPKSENPIGEPAIVLIDEIELGLHPQQQKKIAPLLTQLFPKTQFVFTTNSPAVLLGVPADTWFFVARRDEDGDRIVDFVEMDITNMLYGQILTSPLFGYLSTRHITKSTNE